jgi:hypothetical protein
MALNDRDIVITPNKGQNDDPKIVFSGANASVSAQNITLRVYPDNAGTLSFEGSAGQLFSITNDLTGTLFSINDGSGIPSLEVNADGTVTIAEFSGNVGIGTGTPVTDFHVQGQTVITGRVGIGTANVVTLNSNILSVYGTAMVFGNIDLGNPTGGTSGLYFNDGTYQTTAFTGATTPSFGAAGTIQFAGAGNTFSGDTANLFWDDTNNRLGLGTQSPAGTLDVRGGLGVTAASNFGSSLAVASLASNGAVSGTTGTFTSALYGASFNTAGTATVASLVSNGAVSGTTGTFTSALYGASFNTAGTATVASLVSNGAVSGTTGTFTGALYGGSFNTAGTATVNAVVSNGAITGTTITGTAGTFTSIQNSGLERAANFVSNTWIHATQNLTVASSNTSTSTTTGALVVTGGAGIGGNVFAASFQPTSSVIAANGMYLPSADIVAFSTASTERVRIDSSGRVGIATTAVPQGVIDIGGGTASNIQAVFTRSPSDANFQLIARNGVTGTASGTEVSRFGLRYGSGDVWNTGIRFFRGSGSTDGSLAIDTGGSERMRIHSSGGVSIGGTTDPGARNLIVTGDIFIQGLTTETRSIEIGTQRTSNGTSLLDLVGDNTYSDYGSRFIREGTGPNAETAIYHRGTGALRIAAQEAAPILFVSVTERMRIDAAGNVGIATTTVQTGFTLQTQGNQSVSNRIGVGTIAIAGVVNTAAIFGTANIHGNVRLLTPTGGTAGVYFSDGTYQTTAFTGLATPSFGTPGTVQIAGAGNTFSGDSSSFFWDNGNKRLGINTNAPATVLTVVSTATPAWFNTINSAVSSNNFEILIGNGTSTGTTVGYVNNTTVPYGYISSGASTRNIIIAANGRVGIGGVTAPQVLLDVGGTAVIGASWAGNSNFINPPANGLAVQGSVGIGTYTPLGTLDVRGGVGVTAASNFGSSLTVSSLVSNGAITGTTITGTAGTFTSSQNSGLERAANFVSNTWIHATQNLTVASSNTSTSTTTGAAVITGGVGIGGNVNAGGVSHTFNGSIGIRGNTNPWGTSYSSVIQLKAPGSDGGTVSLASIDVADTLALVRNAYFQDAVDWRYSSLSPATIYQQDATGTHSWGYGLGENPGNLVAFTYVMQVDQSGMTASNVGSFGNMVAVGKIGIGTISDVGLVNTASFFGTVNTHGNIRLITPTGGTAGVYFTDGTYQTTANGPGFNLRTSNYTASNGDKLLCDTSGGTFTVTLPASPIFGSTVMIYDRSDFTANPLNIARNGSTIEGVADDFILDIGQTRNEIVYDGATWHIYVSIGPRGLPGSNAATTTSIAYSIALG